MGIRLKIRNSVIEDVELVILDKDGTLTDLYTYWSWIAKTRAALIVERLGLKADVPARLVSVMGLDEKNGRFKPEGPIGVKKRSEVLAAVVADLKASGVADPQPACEWAFAHADELAGEKLDTIVKPIPGALEFIGRLAGRCKVAVATADNTERARVSLGHLGVRSIDLIVGGDQVQKSKPDPQTVQIALKKLGVQAAHAVMVGDSQPDSLCARNAGLKASIAVPTGTTAKSDLIKVSDYVVDSLDEIEVL